MFEAFDTPSNSANSASTDNVRVCQSADALKQEKATAPTTHRAISIQFRNPARFAGIVIDGQPWQQMRSALGEHGAAYAPLLDAVLETAAKAILTRRIGDMSVFPTFISASLFTADAILSEATSGNTEWLSKDELTALWKESATFKRFSADPRGQGNSAQAKAFRQAVSNFGDLIGKLSGKTSQFTPKELDTILAKLDEADYETQMGAFVVRRIDAIRNRPVKADVDMDML